MLSGQSGRQSGEQLAEQLGVQQQLGGQHAEQLEVQQQLGLLLNRRRRSRMRGTLRLFLVALARGMTSGVPLTLIGRIIGGGASQRVTQLWQAPSSLL